MEMPQLANPVIFVTFINNLRHFLHRTSSIFSPPLPSAWAILGPIVLGVGSNKDLRANLSETGLRKALRSEAVGPLFNLG